jgi:hypothetical protein
LRSSVPTSRTATKKSAATHERTAPDLFGECHCRAGRNGIPPDASPETIKAALVAAEEARVAAEVAETKRLRGLFLGDEKGDEKDKPE